MPLWALWLSRPPPGGSSAHSRPGWARCPGADHVVLQEPLHQQPLEGGDGTVVAAAVGASLAALPASPWAETGCHASFIHTHTCRTKADLRCVFPVTLLCDTL